MDIFDQKEVDANDAYIEALGKYIGSTVVIPGHDYITVLSKVKHRKCDNEGNPIGYENHNPILENIIY